MSMHLQNSSDLEFRYVRSLQRENKKLRIRYAELQNKHVSIIYFCILLVHRKKINWHNGFRSEYHENQKILVFNNNDKP